MYCTNCGSKVHEQASFCTGCGQKLKHEGDETAELADAVAEKAKDVLDQVGFFANKKLNELKEKREIAIREEKKERQKRIKIEKKKEEEKKRRREEERKQLLLFQQEERRRIGYDDGWFGF